MEILANYDELKKVVSGLKSQGKVIGRFGTCGGIHQGHLAGIDFVRDKADVVIVTFNDWINPAIYSMSGLSNFMFPPYTRQRPDDIEKLEQTGKVDYLIRVPFSEKIWNEVTEARSVLVKEDEFFRKHNLLTNPNAQWFGLIAAIAAQWYCPEHDLADIVGYGAKDAVYVLLAEAILRKYDKGVLGKVIEFYPVVRSKDLFPLSSSELLSTDVEKVAKEKQLFEYFKHCYLELRKTGRVPEYNLEEKWRLYLIEKDTLQFVEVLESGKPYFFVCLKPYKVGNRTLVFRDCFDFVA